MTDIRKTNHRLVYSATLSNLVMLLCMWAFIWLNNRLQKTTREAIDVGKSILEHSKEVSNEAARAQHIAIQFGTLAIMQQHYIDTITATGNFINNKKNFTYMHIAAGRLDSMINEVKRDTPYGR